MVDKGIATREIDWEVMRPNKRSKTRFAKLADNIEDTEAEPQFGARSVEESDDLATSSGVLDSTPSWTLWVALIVTTFILSSAVGAAAYSFSHLPPYPPGMPPSPPAMPPSMPPSPSVPPRLPPLPPSIPPPTHPPPVLPPWSPPQFPPSPSPSHPPPPPPLLNSLVRVPIQTASLDGDESGPAGACIDGSRTSECMGGWGGNEVWLSVEVPQNTDVALIALYSYMTRGGMELAPFEIWLGDSHGALDEICAGPIEENPNVDGTPLYIPCNSTGRPRRFVTLKERGNWRAFFLSEMVVYARGDASAAAPKVLPPRNSSAAVAIIQERFDNGEPSNDAARAGVLFHKFDIANIAQQEWNLCVGRTCQSPVDHISCSLINKDRSHPWAYGLADYVGVILAADTPILCGYFGDVGTGGSVNGACGFCTADGCRGGGRGYDLAEAIRNSDGQNEVIVGQLHWEQHQPEIFAAVVFLGPDGEVEARAAHARFLANFGLSGAELPLVRYDWQTGTFHDETSPRKIDELANASHVG